jgi:hypothetical protein
MAQWPNSWAPRITRRVSENGSPFHRERGSARGFTPCCRAPARSVVTKVTANSRIWMKG